MRAWAVNMRQFNWFMVFGIWWFTIRTSEEGAGLLKAVITLFTSYWLKQQSGMKPSIIFAMLAGENHNTIPLATARISLEAHFAGKLKKCSEKLTELCKLEKQYIWSAPWKWKMICQMLKLRLNWKIEIKSIIPKLQRKKRYHIRIHWD